MPRRLHAGPRRFPTFLLNLVVARPTRILAKGGEGKERIEGSEAGESSPLRTDPRTGKRLGSEREREGEREGGERERESERAGGGRPCRARGRERRVGVEEEEEEEEENKRTDRARKSRILQ